MSYSLTEASKLIIYKDFCNQITQRKAFLNMLETYNIIKYYPANGSDYHKRKKWVLTDYIKRFYPDICNCFEETYTDKGFYQLKVTEYGIRNLMEFIYKLDVEVDDYE